MDLKKVYIFRMTHIENIPHIIKNGITHKESPNSNVNYKSIGDNSLISTRDDFMMPNGNLLGQYIPFYFGYRTPMLYVMQNGYNGVVSTEPKNIIYCISSAQKIIETGMNYVYTDGHATDGFSNYYSPEDILNIEEQVDFIATKSVFWKDENDLDLKRRKEAEFLLKEDLGYDNILGFATFDNNSKEKLIKFGVSDKKITVKPNFYF